MGRLGEAFDLGALLKAEESGSGRAAYQVHAPTTKPKTVYITRTGKEYHRDGCRYLSMSKISLKDAKANGYAPEKCVIPQSDRRCRIDEKPKRTWKVS